MEVIGPAVSPSDAQSRAVIGLRDGVRLPDPPPARGFAGAFHRSSWGLPVEDMAFGEGGLVVTWRHSNTDHRVEPRATSEVQHTA
jgi:hypothetical protein